MVSPLFFELHLPRCRILRDNATPSSTYTYRHVDDGKIWLFISKHFALSLYCQRCKEGPRLRLGRAALSVTWSPASLSSLPFTHYVSLETPHPHPVEQSSSIIFGLSGWVERLVWYCDWKLSFHFKRHSEWTRPDLFRSHGHENIHKYGIYSSWCLSHVTFYKLALLVG